MKPKRATKHRLSPNTNREIFMKRHLALLISGAMLINIGASASGCIKGAAAGAVVGHVAGHHAVAGAVGGCLVGRHLAKEKAKKEKEEARAKKALQTPQPVPAK
jgi:membrane associated rhomboid family serine protease